MNQQPLSGIRVVDLTHVLAGPYCTYLLGLLGAEIIKVEIPGGEMGRRMAPPGPLRDAGLGAAFLAQAAGKRMLAVDLRKPEGAEILRRRVLVHPPLDQHCDDANPSEPLLT